MRLIDHFGGSLLLVARSGPRRGSGARSPSDRGSDAEGSKPQILPLLARRPVPTRTAVVTVIGAIAFDDVVVVVARGCVAAKTVALWVGIDLDVVLVGGRYHRRRPRCRISEKRTMSIS